MDRENSQQLQFAESPRGELRFGADGADDVDGLATALLAELDGAGRRGEQRVVATTADVDAGVEVGAALPHQDLAGLDDLPAETLDAEPLRVESRPLRELEAPFLCAMSVAPCYLIPVTLSTVSC